MMNNLFFKCFMSLNNFVSKRNEKLDVQKRVEELLRDETVLSISMENEVAVIRILLDKKDYKTEELIDISNDIKKKLEILEYKYSLILIDNQFVDIFKC